MAAMGSMTTPRRTGFGIPNIMPAVPATGDVRKQISERPRPPWAADVNPVTGLAAQIAGSDLRQSNNVTCAAWHGVGRYVKTAAPFSIGADGVDGEAPGIACSLRPRSPQYPVVGQRVCSGAAGSSLKSS